MRTAGAADDGADAWVNEGQWPHGPSAVEVTPEKQFDKAKRLEDIGDTRQAGEQYRRLADAYCESRLAEESLVRAARTYLSAGDFTKCRDQLKEVQRRYANPTFLDALGEVEINLARGYLEGKGEGGTYHPSSRVRKAAAIFQRQYDLDPQGHWAADALYGLGECAQASADYDGAIKKYKELLEKYPRSELRSEAESQIATCINLREPLPRHSDADTETVRKQIAQEKFDALSGNDNDTDLALLEEHEKILADRLARKRYEQAVFYAKNGHFRAAEVYLELIKERYADSPWAEKAKQELENLRKR